MSVIRGNPRPSNPQLLEGRLNNMQKPLICSSCYHNNLVTDTRDLEKCDKCINYGVGDEKVNMFKSKNKTFNLIDEQINPERNKIEVIEIWKTNGDLIAYIENGNVKYLEYNYLIEKSYKFK